MELELSTSPRAVWVWAPNADDAGAPHAFLVAAGRGVWQAQGGNSESRTLDVGIGVEALDALTTLAEAGYQFRWHRSQGPLNRASDLFGIPVGPS